MLPSFIDPKSVPHKPGIYIFKSKDGEILYVGKAIDLYSRVNSYFNSQMSNSFKTSHMVERIRGLETIVVESELEALILEANLIKKYLPPYNIRLTDDKDYLYIALTDESFPRVVTARKKDLKLIRSYFGPFPSGSTVKGTLKQLRRVFPWCQSPPKVRYEIHNTNNKIRSKPCFYYHIGLCPGACAGKINREDYLKIIRRFEKFMSGDKEGLLTDLESEMVVLSEQQNFEKAAKIKNLISNIQYLTQPNRVSKYLENKNYLELENLQAIKDLQKDLNLVELPERIEAYDISNLQGVDATGSMVVLTRGEIDKSQYRKFKIRLTGKPNDYAMHAEMMQRRLKHPEWGVPQLILIDGGRGQARAAQSEILSSEFKIPVFGLAKRMEWLYPPEGDVVKLPKRSLALRLLQRIRNESHRFAINYHRKLRSRAFLPKAS